MHVLSIQSSVAYGHVGNSAAVFVLQRLGHEAWPVNTVSLSNHPGHGGFRGRITPAAEITDLVTGLNERGLLAGVAAVLTGYMGAAEQGTAVSDAVALVKAANPAALWALDPVLGDHGRVYVKAGIPEFLREYAMPTADLLTPNQFELGYLAGRPAADIASARLCAEHLYGLGRQPAQRLIVATGLRPGAGGPGTTTMLAVSAAGTWAVTTPAFDIPGYGAGDTFAALFLGFYLNSRDPAAALGAAASAIYAVLAETARAGSVELALIGAQNELLAPSRRFAAERIA
jgi:pyridoxine kinase